MIKAERVYKTLTNEVNSIARLGADSLRFPENWNVSIRTLNVMKIEHETRLNRASRMNISEEKINVLRIITNSIENEEKRLKESVN